MVLDVVFVAMLAAPAILGKIAASWQWSCERPRKRAAVLFGNNYARFPENALRGCCNDVRNVSHELIGSGEFRRDEITKYTDDRCIGRSATTRAGMIKALSDLSARTHAEDYEVVYVHYSGHGCRVRDKKSGRVDECILPSDFEDYPGDEGLITDDWLHAWAMSFHPRTRLVVVFDCCYSGTDLELCRRHGRKVIYLSGCRDDQTSEDAVGIDKIYKYTGAMTTCMIEVLRRTPSLFGDAVRLHAELCALLKRDGFDQVPCLSSTQDLKLDPTFVPVK
jgi:hypothetical protein